MKRILRWLKNKYQKLTRGYSDEELWSLDATFIKWILPRLKTYKEHSIGYPVFMKSKKKWDDELETMIKAFELYMEDPCDLGEKEREEQNEIIKKGFALFGKRIPNLWY